MPTPAEIALYETYSRNYDKMDETKNELVNQTDAYTAELIYDLIEDYVLMRESLKELSASRVKPFEKPRKWYQFWKK